MADVDGMQGALAGEEGILFERVFSDLKGYGLGKSAETRLRLQQSNVTTETLKQTILANIVNNAPRANNLPLFADLIRNRSECLANGVCQLWGLCLAGAHGRTLFKVSQTDLTPCFRRRLHGFRPLK